MITPERVSYALVDGVCYPHAAKRLYARDDVAAIEPLYMMTRWASLWEHGPILVRMNGAGLLDEALGDEQAESLQAISWLASHADIETVSEHLRAYLEFTAEDQSARLLRLADPLVTRHWLNSYSPADLSALLGPIETWWVACWTPGWERPAPPTWQTFQAPPTGETANAAFTSWGPAQSQALEEVTRWRFKERLTSYFQTQHADTWARLMPETRGDWLDARISDALDWGASTERQIAIWLELSMLHGEDFMTRPGGLHARWQASHRKQPPLPRLQTLYALDAWHSQGEPTNAENSAPREENESLHG